jgi:flagellar biosynthesis GTPase FlhF
LRPMASQYLQPQRQHVTYSPNKQTNGTQQVPATSMYTTSSGFQTFQTVLTPTYTDANGEHVTKIEPHDGEHQQLRVLMPVQNGTGSGTQIKFVDASSAGNSVIFSTSNGSYAQNGTIVYQNVQQQHPQQYQTIQVHQAHGQIGHQIVNGQIINGSSGQGHFSNPVQYIVVQSAPNPNGNAVPIEIKNEIVESPNLSSQEGGVREIRRAKDANRKRRRRLTESEEEAQARRQKNLEAKRRRLARETEEERRRRRQRDAEAKRKRRERETEEQRLARLKRDSERMRRTRRLKKLQNKDGDPVEVIIQTQPQQQVQQQQSHSQSSHQPTQQRTITVSNHHPQPRIIHHPKQEPTSYLSSNSSAAINQTIAAVVDNKHSNMVVLDQKPIPQGAFITSTNHPHTIQIPANSMVQTVAVPQGMLIPSSQGGHGVQQIILLPPNGQPANAITIPPGTQIIHQRHPDSSASSVSSSFIQEQQQPIQQQQQQQQTTSMLPDDPTERQRIRNKERARRRRALETPEQRALRNMKTAERMRRRRAQLAEQRALEHGISQPVKVILTEEEYNHRFDDIFEAVLKRADYEVENNGPIVPRAKFPPGYEPHTTYVIEHMDSSELQTDGDVNEEEIEYKPSLDEDGNTNGADDSNPHEHESSMSHDEDEEMDEDDNEEHESHVDQQQQMLQRL